jgi:fructose transport system ATP-binding protein
MTQAMATSREATQAAEQPILEAEGLVKLFGRVVGLRGVDLRLYPGEVLAVIGDNGAGKSTLIKCLSGAMVPDRGTLKVDGRQVTFRSTQEARAAGIETVYQTLAVAPALDIASKSLGISTLQNINQAVETLSGGQRQIVAVARTGAFGSKIAILDEPTAALGVRETAQVLRLVKDLREQGLGVILISHNMPNVFDTADRIHVQRLGGRAAVISPKTHSMQDAVAIMTGAMTVPEEEQSIR